MKKIWITWEKQRRNEGISSGIDAELFELRSSRKGLLRYYELTGITYGIIRKSAPDIIFAQNPSIVLALFVVLCSRLFRYRAIIDAHNSGIFPYDSRYALLNLLSRYIQRHAYMTIVTNSNLCQHVEENGGKGFVLPDHIPTPPEPERKVLEGDKKIVVICTYSSDEPYMEVINAAKHLGSEYKIYYTGNYNGKVDPATLPGNVVLLGYLSEKAYWDTLYSADAIMDLTTRENCLVCGAYEGISLNKPLILSNTAVNRDFFHRGCVYVDADYQSIRDGILECFSHHQEYQNQIVTLKKELQEEWEQKRLELLRELVIH